MYDVWRQRDYVISSQDHTDESNLTARTKVSWTEKPSRHSVICTVPFIYGGVLIRAFVVFLGIGFWLNNSNLPPSAMVGTGLNMCFDQYWPLRRTSCIIKYKSRKQLTNRVWDFLQSPRSGPKAHKGDFVKNSTSGWLIADLRCWRARCAVPVVYLTRFPPNSQLRKTSDRSSLGSNASSLPAYLLPPLART